MIEYGNPGGFIRMFKQLCGITPQEYCREKKKHYKHVVLIGFDGAGTYFRNTETPNYDRIMERGAVNYEVLTAEPTISAECWGSMLIGVTARIHRITNHSAGIFTRNSKSDLPSVFRAIRESMPQAEMASFCEWGTINHGIVEDDLNVYKVNVQGGGEIVDKLSEYLKDNIPNFLFVAFDFVDAAGHKHGYGSEKYFENIQMADAYLGQIYEVLERKGILEDTLLLVTADHGGKEHYHGGKSDEEKYVMFAACGKEVPQGIIGEMEIRDTAAIVLYALGVEQPKSWTARVPSGIFPGFGGEERPKGVHRDYDNPQRDRRPRMTPAIDTGASVVDIVGRERVRAYHPFDGEIIDVTGKIQTSQMGKLYFVDGYFGQGIRIEDGGMVLEPQNLGNKSFSVAFWMKTSGMGVWTNLFSNKKHKDNEGIGLELSIGVGMMRFILRGEKGKYPRVELQAVYPPDFRDGWVYVAAVVDREKETISVSYDFGEFLTLDIPEEYKDKVFNGDGHIYIGTDKPGILVGELYTVLDEYLLLEGALTREDLQKLAQFYDVV